MSEFLDLYRECKQVEARMRRERFKLGFEEYQKLKDKKEELTKKLKTMANEPTK